MKKQREGGTPDGLLNIRTILSKEHGWRDNIEDSYTITTIEGNVVLLSDNWVVDIRQGRKLIPIQDILKRGRKIYFNPECLIKLEYPISQSDLPDEDIVKHEWSLEMATFCPLLTDLYEAVGEVHIIEKCHLPDRAIIVRAVTGPNRAKTYMFPVFCLQLPDAIYLEYSRTV